MGNICKITTINYVTGGSVECAKVLIEAGADIELEDVKGQTPLFVATSTRKTELMKV